MRKRTSPSDALPRLTIAVRDEDAENLKVIRSHLEPRTRYMTKSDVLRTALKNYAAALSAH